MPIVTIQVTGDPVSDDQKERLIAESTLMLQKVLNKDPDTTFVLIEEIPTTNWGLSGKSVTEKFRKKKEG